MGRKQTKATEVPEVPIGTKVDLDGPNGFVRLPTGVVVTCRQSYVVQHEGEHQIEDLVFVGVKADDEAEAES